MIIDDEQQNDVGNLTGEQVNRLDKATFLLKMDTLRNLYNGRTRLGDESGHQLTCTFYGMNAHTRDCNERYEFEHADSNDETRFADALEV